MRRFAPPVVRSVASQLTGQSPAGSFHGVFCVCKPAGATSANVVAALKKVISPRATLEAPDRPRARYPDRRSASSSSGSVVRIGHGGTLDRLATGVLVIGVGHGTKQLQDFLASEKVYVARGRLGVESPTYDLDGVKVDDLIHQPYGHVTLAGLESFLAEQYRARIGGIVRQTPPLYSALKLDGKRLSGLARAGKGDQVDLERKRRDVQVYSIKVTDWQPPFYTVEVKCGAGFYVRSLVHDIGAHFACGSVLVDLRRTRQSGFALDQQHVLHMGHMRVTNEACPDPAVDAAPASAAFHQAAAAAGGHHLACTRDAIAEVLSIPLETRQAAVHTVKAGGTAAGV
ncbi:MAG: hypothetical protein P4L81_06295 [Candidatus Pacebacteria bacterium]|nr:hypothetical protein [Candidatus Paceibacterota bacterium]